MDERIQALINIYRDIDHGQVFQGTKAQEIVHQLLLDFPNHEAVPPKLKKAVEDIQPSISMKDFWQQLKDHDVQRDYQNAKQACDRATAEFEKWKPVTIEGEREKQETLRTLRDRFEENVKSLQYIARTPMTSSFDLGGREFYRLVEELGYALYRRSIIYSEKLVG